jgi:hypothetical protein
VLWGEQLLFYNSKPAWVDEPILRETLFPEEISPTSPTEGGEQR